MVSRGLQVLQPLTLKYRLSWLPACGDRQLCRPPLEPLSKPGTNSPDRRPTRPRSYSDDTEGEGPASSACRGSLSLSFPYRGPSTEQGGAPSERSGNLC